MTTTPNTTPESNDLERAGFALAISAVVVGALGLIGTIRGFWATPYGDLYGKEFTFSERLLGLDAMGSVGMTAVGIAIAALIVGRDRSQNIALIAIAVVIVDCLLTALRFTTTFTF